MSEGEYSSPLIVRLIYSVGTVLKVLPQSLYRMKFFFFSKSYDVFKSTILSPSQALLTEKVIVLDVGLESVIDIYKSPEPIGEIVNKEVCLLFRFWLF